jgi:exocyst complex component 4
METILESLAVLGRLGSALDIVAQRLPGEIFSLVDQTLDEVSERAEYGRRGSTFALNNGSSNSEGVYIFSADPALVVTHKNEFLKAATLRLAALESSSQQMDHEILNDFFWTLYSKMDAVAQGLRVVYEVANRIGSVSCIQCIHHFGTFLTFSHSEEISRIPLGPSLVRSSLWKMFGLLYKRR